MHDDFTERAFAAADRIITDTGIIDVQYLDTAAVHDLLRHVLALAYMIGSQGGSTESIAIIRDILNSLR